MLNAMLLIFAVVFASRGNLHKALIITQSVPENTSLTLNCSSSKKTPSTHVWWYYNTIIFAKGIQPSEVGIHNIRGTFVDSTLSYLHFDRFVVTNSGNYTCTKGRNDSVSYILDIVETTDPPTLVTKSVMKNTSLTIYCSSAANTSKRHIWWFNGKVIFANGFQPSEIGIYNEEGGHVNFTVSFLKIDGFSLKNTGNYTCDDEQAANTFYMLDIKGSDPIKDDDDSQRKGGGQQDNRLVQFIPFNPVVVLASGFAILLASLCFIFAVCKKVKTAVYYTRRGSRALSTTSVHLNVIEKNNIFIENDPSSAYEDTGIPFFSHKDVCLHDMISSSPSVLRFVGSLRNCNRNVTNVLVSGKADNDNTLQNRMWKNYVDAVLRFVGHCNLLEPIGLCRESDEIFLIQYYYEKTLKLHLQSIFHHSEDEETTTFAQRSYLQLAGEVINGIEFLSSKGCIHPGLSTEKILMNSNDVCQLYDFCTHEDIKIFTDINFPKNERLLMIGLAPEYKLSGEYTPASDMWSLGTTVWEIYSAGEETLEEPDVDFVEKFRSGIIKLPKPKHCSQRLFDILELCWSTSCENRPKISDLRLKLDESMSKLEENRDISSKVDEGICKDLPNDELNMICKRHVYQVLEANAQ